MGEPGWLAGIPASFTPDVLVASIQFCLRQGGGQWGGGAGSTETAQMVSNYTFPFRKKIFFPKETLNDSSWKNLFDFIYSWNTFLTDKSVRLNLNAHLQLRITLLVREGGGTQKAQSCTELAVNLHSTSHLHYDLGQGPLSKLQPPPHGLTPRINIPGDMCLVQMCGRRSRNYSLLTVFPISTLCSRYYFYFTNKETELACSKITPTEQNLKPDQISALSPSA